MSSLGQSPTAIVPSPFPGFSLIGRDATQRDAVFERASIGMALTGAGGFITRVNPSFQRITGYGPEEAHTLFLGSVLDEPGFDAKDPWITSCRRANGEIVQVRATCAVLDRHTRLVTIDDVSPSQHEMEALRKRETIARVAAEHASDAIFEWDTKIDRLTIHGPGRLGMSEEEAPKSFSEWSRRVHPADLELVRAAIRNHYETRRPASVRYRITRSDGRQSVVEARGSAFWEPGGDGTVWIGSISDVTETLRHEEAISQLAAIVESSNDAIIGCDLDYSIASWNSGAERLYGYTAEEAIGRSISLVMQDRPDYSEWIGAESPDKIAIRQTESVHLTKKGTCPVSVTVSPIRRKDGRTTGFSLIAHDVSEQQRNERQMRRLALHDPLTDLPNRRLLREYLSHAIADSARDGRMLAVIFLDMDGFKSVNDTLGHMIGDELLRGVATRLKSCTRRSDMLSRTGGDEFVLVARGLRNRESAQILASNLMECFREPFLAGGNQMSVDASLGISVYPDGGDDADALLSNADIAMYEAKRLGGNQIRFFTHELADTLRARAEIARGLPLALENKEFSLTFQPVFDTASNRIARFEALVRWRQASGMDIDPSRFIPVSEETGWIVPIGEWVLREACRSAAEWQSGQNRGVGVSVNVSAVQFARSDFIATLKDALKDSGLDAGLLELELTESIFVHNPAEAARTMASIRALGVSLALDDFGTGYSSLSYLRDLPVDALKLDRSFVSGIESSSSGVAMIQSLVALAHSLGKRVVAEGVETDGQLELLSSTGCDEMQGYLLGKPLAMPAARETHSPELVFDELVA